jgi:DNA-binding beta-propeller fold protein YncE
MAFDGVRLWMTNPRIFDGGQGSVSIITPGAATPWSSTTIVHGFLQPFGLVFDGSNMWVTDYANQTIDKMDSGGGFIQIITVGNKPLTPAFDGTNIWVPNSADNSISVVRASTGIVIATLTGNGLNSPQGASFDGQRILVGNQAVNQGSVSLWKASDLTPLGSFPMPSGFSPTAVACDGINFWFPIVGGFSNNFLARF